ncbi:G-coupled receptor 1-like protein, putative [Babesia ovata]|uniref:G-coupled receptor 1-like protein, putative n=1 Tax=Babesia ovata TaxID=189622 RepID=A0A2H6KIP2_9APIC|nr:G-coupled receptor 1-like protein, putative [Babesia ovata]GBE62860.1 G-coupled receptor 1-like protein, putative [Babesia ovata]
MDFLKAFNSFACIGFQRIIFVTTSILNHAIQILHVVINIFFFTLQRRVLIFLLNEVPDGFYEAIEFLSMVGVEIFDFLLDSIFALFAGVFCLIFGGHLKLWNFTGNFIPLFAHLLCHMRIIFLRDFTKLIIWRGTWSAARLRRLLRKLIRNFSINCLIKLVGDFSLIANFVIGALSIKRLFEIVVKPIHNRRHSVKDGSDASFTGADAVLLVDVEEH